MCASVYISNCVCVLLYKAPFIVDVRLHLSVFIIVDAPAGVKQEEGHKGVSPFAVLALFFLSREG